jgi:methylisocitrate lyase
MSVLKDNINSGASALARLVKRSCITAPGVYNGISSILAEKAGFKALYLSGAGVAANAGLPDLSVTTLSEVAEEARRIVAVTTLPLIVDVDTGFGETLNVIRTVRVMETVGAAAIHIEDQQLPKKCGQLSGKRLVKEEDMTRKIRAAVASKKDDDFMIIARTDARGVEGFEGAVRRSKLYLEAGADAIFPEALATKEEFSKFAKLVKAPLLANMTEFGVSPLLTAGELGRMGYRITIFPLTAFRASIHASEKAYANLARAGTQKGFVGKLMTRKRFYDIIGYDEYEQEDRAIYNQRIW